MSGCGSSGGITTLWSKDLFSLENSFVSQHWIFTKLRHFSSKITLSLFNLYVPVTFQEKRHCWNSLDVFLVARNPSNIIIVGDLNIALAPKDKKGGNCGRDPMIREVERIISSWDLIDFKPKKGRYTWSNNRIVLANISARLDRFLLQSSFLTENKIISSSILSKLSRTINLSDCNL